MVKIRRAEQGSVLIERTWNKHTTIVASLAASASISGFGTTAQRYALWYPVRHGSEACVSMVRAASP